MGATTFSTIAKGKTVQDAFHQAVEQAQYDHGHAGYTGTIAEKDGFVLSTPPAGVTAAQWLAWIEAYEPPRTYWQNGREVQEASARIPDGVPDQHVPALRQAGTAYDDKWGPAVAIPWGDQAWLFCGWASC